jgi:hypothetical protein
MTQAKFRAPSPADPHYVFWCHLKSGGRVWRNDPTNNSAQWLDLNELGGDPNKIVTYGYRNLSLEGPPIDTSRPLYDSDGYLHTFVDRSAVQIVTRQYGQFAIWEAQTGKLLAPDTAGPLYLSNIPLSEEQITQRKEQGAKVLESLKAHPST